MNAKKFKIKYQNGKELELGSIHKNEMCRLMVEVLGNNQYVSNALQLIIGNIKASADAST